MQCNLQSPAVQIDVEKFLKRAAAPAFYLCIGLILAEVQRGVRFDDPFITYRYAVNLASGHGFVFNPGESTLITTAPLYALLLALVQMLGVAPHVSSPVISIASLVIGAWGLWEFGRVRSAAAGFAAGLFFLTAPLAWLTIGFETPTFLATAIWALVAADRKRPVVAGILTAIGMGLRGDGVLVAATVLCVLLLRLFHWKTALRFAIPILVLYGALAGWLILQFGSPIPSTLQTKAAQAVSGLTGFYPFTKYPEGAWLLLRAWIEQNAAFGLWPLLSMIGVATMVRQLRGNPERTTWIFTAPILWAAVHAAGYTTLGVAPYVWYYAPLLPGLAWAAGLGAQRVVERMRLPWSIVVTLGAALVTATPAHWHAFLVLRGGTPPDPGELASKILPEAKVDVYEVAGRWIAASTPTTSTLGMSELGVMSYFSNRPTVDFLGLTRPMDSADVRHGDFLAQVVESLPNYQLLPMRNSVYDVDPQKEGWFLKLYRPVHSVDDARFWGTPLTIWERMSARPDWSPLPGVSADLGDGWSITKIESSVADLASLPNGDQPLLLRALLRAGAPLGARTLRMQPVLIDGGDGLAVVSRVIHTDRWKPGEERWVHFPALTRKPDRAQVYAIEFSWLESPNARTQAAMLPAQPAGCNTNSARSIDILPLSDGFGVMADVEPETAPGTMLTGRLFWRAGAPTSSAMTAFVHVRDEAGSIISQADHPLRHQGRTFPTSVWKVKCLYEDEFSVAVPPDLAPGRYDLIVGLYDPATGMRWPVDDAPHRTADGGVRAASLTVR